jgi:hypothetical protein
MKIKGCFWGMVTFAALASGCGTRINDLPLNSPDRAMVARDPQSVEVFSTRKPTRPYVEVSMLEAQQASAYSTDAPGDVMLKLRDYAAQKGCDAIIMGGANDSTVGSGSVSNGNGSSYVTTLKGYRATCIVYTGPEAAVSDANASSGVSFQPAPVPPPH